jgi:hypothetical protein
VNYNLPLLKSDFFFHKNIISVEIEHLETISSPRGVQTFLHT